MSFPSPCSLRVIIIVFASFVAVACSEKTAPMALKKNEHNPRLVGTWELKARIAEGTETPASERQMKLVFRPDETFQALYRGEPSQQWVSAGQGGFSYEPPILNLYWETGPTLSLLVKENDSDSLLLHHGRNLVPLKDQEPAELFVRQKPQGPTKTPS